MPAFVVFLIACLWGGAAMATEYGIGISTLTVVDPVSGQPVPVTVWYPAAAVTAGDVHRGPYLLRGVENAAPADGSFGLIVLSHGSGGSPIGHHDTAAALTEAGWIVAAPLHVGDNYRDQSSLGTPALFEGRPRTLSAVIDSLVAGRAGLPRVNAGRVGVLGFSMGGYTALVTAGAVADMELIASHCAKHAAEDSTYCGYVPETMPHVVVAANDQRVKAAAVWAPLAAPFSDAALASIDVPVAVWVGSADTVLPSALHGDRVARFVHGAEKIVVADARHFSFLAPLPAEAAARNAELASDAPGFDRVAMHDRLNTEVTAFFARALPE
ncbi:MAG: hypothetical protein LDL26_00915 [Caenispirillum bisanense]|nr:hypothetical protein [Caenispirillum bisanense]MCA1973572.1 hypothetical protein [Caenispirillum sp.]